MNDFAIILSYAYCLLMAAAVTAGSLPLVHMLQLESYQGPMYLRWLKRHARSDFVPYLLTGAVALMLRCCYMLLYAASARLAMLCYILADSAYIALLALQFVAFIRGKAAKPLVYTGRVKRLLAAECVLALCFSASFFISVPFEWGYFLLGNAIRYLPGALAPLFVLLCHLVTLPVEEGIKRRYFNDAKARLAAREGLIRIAVTGSFGKTGTKYALATILSERYRVLFTPGSFNTPMGVTRVIREQLNDEHEVFIAEMGARYRGDVAELSRLVAPQYGVITAVGEQHLDTFGSLDAVIAGKGELMEALASGGCCFLNGDNPSCRAMYDSRQGEAYLYGTEGEGLFMRASDIEVTAEGSTFTLTDRDGESVSCASALLGRHNIENLTGAAALARRLGLTMHEIRRGIAKAEPVEHRLQLIRGAVTVIDDAFNANPIGSKEALNVLSGFPGRRIVVTPGMVELGSEEERINREFGAHMAHCADIAIIIGKAHADPICEGLLEAGFPESCLVRADSLSGAMEKLPAYTEPGCVVLFENDLPDNFKE